MADPTTNDAARSEDLGFRKLRTRLDKLLAIERSALAPVDDLFHIQHFIEGLKVINKRGELVSLIMNRSQEQVFHRLMECREKRTPARFICCKSRQLGISTLIQAFIFALVTHYANRFGLVVAHSIESAQLLFSMTQRFLHHVPHNVAQPLARSTVRRIEYGPPHYSSLKVDTAANRTLGRGGTLHYVHASEVAFWDRPEEPILAINQAVPQHWDTLLFWESTANGVQNLFHTAWVAAERGESDMEPIFLSWKGFPEYFLPVAKREQLSLSPQEKEYGERHGIDPGQLKWACSTRKNQCHDSWEKFHQEYPVAPELAFAFTGMPWFSQEVIRKLLDHVACEPILRGHLVFFEPGSLIPVFVESPNGPLEIWKSPDSSLSYSLGMDVGEGVGADYTVIQVICNESGEVAACYRSNRVRAETAGLDAWLLGSYYHFGLLGIERNGPGLATLAVCEHGLAEYPQLTGYPNLYYHTFTDRKIPEETRRLGWITNRATKEAMLSRLAETVETHGLTVFSRHTLLEMQGFVWDAEKKMFRQSYRPSDTRLSHDDEIMALAIANEMRSRTWENRFISGRFPKGGDF